ncbi:MAG: hypothetical protein ACRDQ4_19710 [Pseudonocardiaceae bacterium]
MATVPSLADVLAQRLSQAIGAALPHATKTDPELRRSDRADWQANGVLGLAKSMRANPRQLAEQVVGQLPTDEIIAAREVSGPGFINLTISDAAIIGQLAARAGDPRLGLLGSANPGITVIDYSQPNSSDNSESAGQPSMSRLNRLYRDARARFDSEPDGESHLRRPRAGLKRRSGQGVHGVKLGSRHE